MTSVASNEKDPEIMREGRSRVESIRTGVVF
jgi:hypothetical protein